MGKYITAAVGEEQKMKVKNNAIRKCKMFSFEGSGESWLLSKSPIPTFGFRIFVGWSGMVGVVCYMLFDFLWREAGRERERER